MSNIENKLMTAAEYIADQGKNLDEAIAGDIFEIMADYTKYVLFFMKLNNLKPDQVEVKGSDK
jgi:hypothetical protein